MFRKFSYLLILATFSPLAKGQDVLRDSLSDEKVTIAWKDTILDVGELTYYKGSGPDWKFLTFEFRNNGSIPLRIDTVIVKSLMVTAHHSYANEILPGQPGRVVTTLELEGELPMKRYTLLVFGNFVNSPQRLIIHASSKKLFHCTIPQNW